MKSRKRRGRGEGGVFERSRTKKDGGKTVMWVAEVFLGYDDSGKRVRKNKYAKTKKEALSLLRDMQAKLDAGQSLSESTITVGAYLQQWFKGRQASLALTTQRTQEGVIRNHIVPYLGRTKLKKLRPFQVKSFYDALQQQGVGQRTRNMVHNILRPALKEAVNLEMISDNPCDKVVHPKPPKPKIRYFTEDEARCILAAAQGERLEALFVLAVMTGMRKGELLALHWDDINLKEGTLRIRASLAEIKGGHVRKCPKTKTSGRLLELPPMAVAKLREHRKKMLAEGNPGPIVFCNTVGNYIWRNGLEKRVYKPLLKRAQVRELPFHSLRHTFASIQFAQRTPPKVVQEYMGHASIATTLDTYSHMMPSMQGTAAKGMENFFNAENALPNTDLAI